MPAAFQRAVLLFNQSRYADADAELRRQLAESPHDFAAHALRARCLANQEKFDEAEAEVRQAIVLAPDEPYAHFCRSIVLEQRNRFAEAEAAAYEAVRLDPSDADYYGRLSATLFAQGKWQPAFDAALEGLARDAENGACMNLRTMALTKLGKKTDAITSVDATLARNPLDAAAHANKGWALLHQQAPKAALEHFREALRLDPTFDYARAGMVEALKARNPLYRAMLGYFLWMARLDNKARWGVVLGGYFGAKILRQAMRANPELEPWIVPILFAYLAFVLLTWFAAPLSNLMLRLSPFGRHALSRDQRVSSNWFGACVATGLVGAVVGIGAHSTFGGALALFAFGVALPLTITYHCDIGWPRQMMGCYAAALGAVGIGMVASSLFPAAEGELLPHWGLVLAGLFLVGSLGASWVANWLVSATVRR